MLLLLSKTKSCSAFLPLFSAHRISLPLPRHCSSSAPQNSRPNFAVADYLISSFGFSADKAATSNLPKTPTPSAAFSFNMRKLVTSSPRILCSSPDNTLAPNLTALRDIGLSTTALTHLILTTSATIMSRSAASAIKFWLDFFGGDEEALVRAIHHDGGLVTSAITRVVAPNISVLRNHGLSTHEICMIVLRAPRLIRTGTALLEDMLNRAEELGFCPGSNKFGQGLHAMRVNSREGLRKKVGLFERFKWSEDEFLAALQKTPLWAALSEKTLQDKMDFFVGEARCDPSYIATNPNLLLFSLERRLRLRVRVLLLLESKGHCDEKRGFYKKNSWNDKKFMESYVSPHKEEIPELLEAYRAACAS